MHLNISYRSWISLLCCGCVSLYVLSFNSLNLAKAKTSLHLHSFYYIEKNRNPEVYLLFVPQQIYRALVFVTPLLHMNNNVCERLKCNKLVLCLFTKKTGLNIYRRWTKNCFINLKRKKIVALIYVSLQPKYRINTWIFKNMSALHKLVLGLGPDLTKWYSIVIVSKVSSV